MSAQRPQPTTETVDDEFAWSNQRYGAVIEQHTGIAASLLDHGICLGLTLFGVGSVASALVMAVMQMMPH